jgi:hypothetical protein
METEGSLPHSQVTATYPYPEPTRPSSNPPPHTSLSEDPSEYYPTIYVWDVQVVSFPQVSPPNLCIHLFTPSFVPHAPPISFF